jgi:transposase
MRDTSLLQQALGLAPPWAVRRSDFDPEAHRLDIEIDFAPGSRFACPICGAADCPAYDTERMTWRHLNFFQHEAYLHARVPRVRCDKCGIKTVNVPWARHGSGFTLLFEARRRPGLWASTTPGYGVSFIIMSTRRGRGPMRRA